MATCAEVLATTLREAGVTRMFGLPGGEILDLIEAARRAGIEFVLTRHEAVASLMAEATGRLSGRPGVCVSTLGPGAVNLMLGVANAWLDRAPLIAITATLATTARPYGTHQDLDLNAIYRPFTKETLTLDGTDTAAAVRRAWRTAVTVRPGPVHLALPGDVARREDRRTGDPNAISLTPDPLPAPAAGAVAAMAAAIREARRPAVILGVDLDPSTAPPIVRRFVEALGAPVFATPKAKGILPEDHPQFLGICGGLAGDATVLDFLGRADLLIGVGFDPVESDKLWHHTMRLVSIAPRTIAARAFAPALELTGDLLPSLSALAAGPFGPGDWREEDFTAFRAALERTLRPSQPPVGGLSPWEVTRRVRERVPPETVVAADVGSIKLIVSQAWRTTQPGTFLESNGLSTMGYALPAAMAARLYAPERPALAFMGDGGFSMMIADLETCVRLHLPLVVVVYNDSALSLIQVAQERRGYPDLGVRYGDVDFSAASRAFGAWARRVRTMAELDAAIDAAQAHDGPAVVEVLIDPAEYRAHAAAPRRP
ncbi:MAG TPA: thiamine pyrophosphate-binding protein [Vicinamibacterales bacterium]|nr:thiamine pyrophosphate-binding protein [Vicinamibacterales bacterium]